MRFEAYEPDNKLSEDIVKIDMNLFSMTITNIKRALPPNLWPLL